MILFKDAIFIYKTMQCKSILDPQVNANPEHFYG